ncbi:GNAT family N-acetyltransferase [Winogradskya consettensis]|uniref:GNAT family acetyltransferase n=1 Tax=Winogradskya consettensis TaxID=113560 RepID=A0A919S7I3_9ACTN|nr:GNAT family N-acetyltransferase [Actinoplanes consettensis]GIM67087.1 GNAT family acetyltransferase [Actinoplanes consettensis]
MLNWAGVRTARLLLDRPELDHLDAVHAILAARETNRYNPAGPVKDIAASAAVIREWRRSWDAEGFGYWVVKDGEGIAGFGGLRPGELDGSAALNLYYRFAVSSWGKGYATEMAREAVKLAGRDLPGLPVVAIVHSENVASSRVAERIGLERIGTTQRADGPRLVYGAAVTAR